MPFILVIGGISLSHNPCYGRFNQSDAKQVDQEQHIGSEYYNDLYSYKPHYLLNTRRAKARNGFFINAGSLNAKSFLYEEEIKLSSLAKNKYFLQYYQYKFEDEVEAIEDRYIAVGYQPSKIANFRILADSYSAKQRGDLGLSVQLQALKYARLAYQFWSTDHFYNTKKRHDLNKYIKKPYSYSFYLSVAPNSFSRMDISYNHDLASNWQRLSESYQYHHQRSTLTSLLRIGTDLDRAFVVSYKQDKKQEGKDWYQVDQLDNKTAFKHMHRFIQTTEISFHDFETSGSGYELGFAKIKRIAKYSNKDLDQIGLKEKSSPHSKRSEYAFFAYWLDNHAKDHYRNQWGVYANYLSLKTHKSLSNINKKGREEGSNNYFELKAQYSIDFQINKYSRFIINTTWDLDLLREAFPYKDQAFKPWGGGNFQFLTAF